MNRLTEINQRILLLNLYLTQGVALLLSIAGLYFFYFRQHYPVFPFFRIHSMAEIWVALSLASVVIGVNVLMTKWLPEDYFDDGGINEKIFQNLPLWHIFVIAFIVSISEELLFRVVIQAQIGLWWTSLLFAVVHLRYLKKWVLFSSVLGVSLLLGWLFESTQSVIAPIVCHFTIDFVLACFLRFNVFKK
jgi:membrane protease YdiL (CAAX protease family)